MFVWEAGVALCTNAPVRAVVESQHMIDVAGCGGPACPEWWVLHTLMTCMSLHLHVCESGCVPECFAYGSPTFQGCE